MKKLLRFAAGLSLLGLVGSVAALLAGVGKVEERPPLRFDPDPFVIPHQTDWQGERDFEVTVVNTSDEPARIVGSRDFCGRACLSGVDLPATIPARGRGPVVVHIKKSRPGPVAEELEFFTDRRSQPTLTLRINGHIPESQPRAAGPIQQSRL